MSDLTQGFPRKVIAKARELGVHNDCLAAGPDKECADCESTLYLVWDFFYGDIAAKEDVLDAIVNDIIEDRKVDVL